MWESLNELFNYRCMIRNLVKRDIRGRYKGSILGFIWNFITPLVQILVYIMVFTTVFHPMIDNYAIYLMAGMTIWIWFSESLVEGSGTFVSNSDMIKKIYFPRSVLPISVVLSKLVNFIILSVIFLIIIAIVGHGISFEALLLMPLIIIISFIFITGFVMTLSAINVYFRDIQYIVSVIMMAWVWMTPIMYSTDAIDDKLLLTIVSLNPMTPIVELYQDVFYWKMVPSLETLLICIGIALLTLLIGIVVFKHLEKDFAEVL